MTEIHKHFINRELSWLEFNIRVLEEANNINNPLLERVKFLSISSSNLDEFIMVRVAGLMDQVRNKIIKKSQDGLSAARQLEKINLKLSELYKLQEKSWINLKKSLLQKNINIIKRADITGEDTRKLEKYFDDFIFPILSPITLDPAHPFPFLPNLGIALILRPEDEKKKKNFLTVMLLPNSLPRFVRIGPNSHKYVLSEDIIKMFIGKLFPGNNILDFGVLRVIRDSELEISEEAEDLMQHFESAAKRRRRGKVIFMEVDPFMPKNTLEFLITQLNVEPINIIQKPNIVGLSGIIDLYGLINDPSLKYKPYKERSPERIDDFAGDCFAAIDAKDIVIHHPYETFDVVVKFLQQAAKDPEVVSIKQTLYRTSSDSPVVKALIDAAEAGKSVTVVVELKARFDEESNIKWARDLERVGAQVVFGFVNLKTHAKVSLVIRRKDGFLQSYAHFGTGNYHPVNAKIFSDLSFFTCNKELCSDASMLFNYLTGYAEPKKFNKLIVSPLNLRQTLNMLIDNEIKYAKAGMGGYIWAKMNALTDSEIIENLYKASKAGVKIELFIRGICCLRPGIKNLSENIEVKSMVGRFLEHARIYCFGAGHKLPSPKAKLYIASADWMERNLDSRVEIAVPIENETVHAQIMQQILIANQNDDKQTHIMNPDGTYQKIKSKSKSFSAHEYFMTNPSLSGRGKAMTDMEQEKQKEKILKIVKEKKIDGIV